MAWPPQFWQNLRKPYPSTPEGVRIYAVGDLHGRLDLLNAMIKWIAHDDARRAEAHTVVIFLGDYCDRGPDSKGVVDRLLAVSKNTQKEIRFLCGNHDFIFTDIMQTGRNLWPWLEFGGQATLASYGVTPPETLYDPGVQSRIFDDLKRLVPDSHTAFYETLEMTIDLGDYKFVHAGVRPGVPLEAQSKADYLWIRDVFLKSWRPFDRIIVHGHTPQKAPSADRRRIGLDTGAYSTDILSGVCLDGKEQALFSVTLPSQARTS